ncbi:TPA: site-specific DNA-methyltransferase [Streptococcus pyogenes]|nr:site-specific DNA-methyltransferase [Streptococcus pyogenes NGAS302]HER8328011.1 site-specific DNA-methyltransferase [Streptococcus pyogenes]HES0791757.1 site-specific DNA-methyltransferase [Streptococcus pyogenes]HES1018557.1 site-specific DNA-methyltransferase [Streptococcus pyogenes]HES1527073.1 site-specific DNA-methyltransferase [Streptococcus pyogenes]
MEIKCGNCLELLAELTDGLIDMVITDPPYNISVKNNFATMGRTGIDFGDWDKGFDLLSWIDIASQKLTKNGGMIIFNDWKNLGDIARHCEKNGLVVKDIFRWVKDNPMPRNRDRRYITDSEYGVWVVRKKSKWVFNRKSEKYDRPEYRYPVVAGAEKTQHPTQKPVALMKDIITRHTTKGAVVLDPFMGSGSTGVACLLTGGDFIGYELNKDYFNIANKRIAELTGNGGVGMNIIHRMENGIDAVGDLTTYAVPCCPECKNETYSQKHCPFCGENLMEVANEN